MDALVTDAHRLLGHLPEQELGPEGGRGGRPAGPGRRAGRGTGRGVRRHRRAVADRAAGRPGPGDLHRRSRGPACAQDRAPAAGRVQSPRRGRTRHRAHHRLRGSPRPPARPTATPPSGSTCWPTRPRGPVQVLGRFRLRHRRALAELAQAGHRAVIKPCPLRPAVPGGFTLDDFTVDAAAGTATCPNGFTRPITPQPRGDLRRRLPRLPAASSGAPPARRPRPVTARTRRPAPRGPPARRATDRTSTAAYRRHRPMVERSIAWLTRGNRRSATAASSRTTPGCTPAPPRSTSAASSPSASPAPDNLDAGLTKHSSPTPPPGPRNIDRRSNPTTDHRRTRSPPPSKHPTSTRLFRVS